MEHTRKTHFPNRLLLFISTMCFILFTPVTPMAADVVQEVTGTVYASRLKENARVVLTGSTSIVMDVSRNIRSISGKDYDLYITKDTTGPTLRVLQDQTIAAISAKSVTIGAKVSITAPAAIGIFTSGNLYINMGANVNILAASGFNVWGDLLVSGDVKIEAALSEGIHTNGTIKVQGGSMEIETLRAMNGIEGYSDIILSRGKVTVSGSNGICVKEGDITIGNTVKAVGRQYYGIYAEKGDVTVIGELDCQGKKAGLKGAGEVKIGSAGNVTRAVGAEYGVIGAQKLDLSGTINADGTNGIGLYSPNEVVITGGGRIEAHGETHAIFSERKVLTMAPSVMVLSPPGATIYNGYFVDSTYQRVKTIKIGKGKGIYGSLTIEKSGQLYSGDKLTATLSGAPVGTQHFQWQYSLYNEASSWHNIENANESTLQTDLTDPTRYIRCVVSIDGYANLLHSNAVQVMTSAPVIEEQPYERSGKMGQPIKFHVEASNVKTYQWKLYKKVRVASTGHVGYRTFSRTLASTDAFSVSGQLTSTLTLTPKSMDLNGVYAACELVSPKGVKLRTNYAKISVQAAITEQPKDTSILLGESCTFTVGFKGAKSYAWYITDSGTGGKTYAWSSLPNVISAEGTNTDTLKLTPKSLWANGKKVYCVVTYNSSDTLTSNTAEIKVKSPVTKELSGGNVGLTVGKKYTFKVAATGAISYDWSVYDLGDGQPYAQSTVKTHASVSGQGTSEFSITPKDTWLKGKELGCSVKLGDGIYVEAGRVILFVNPAPTPTAAPALTPTPSGAKPLPKNTEFTGSDGAAYKVTNDKPETPYVSYTSPKSGAKGTVKIPNTISYKGITYKVTSIAAKAFKDNQNIVRVEIGSNVMYIRSSSFYNCKKLESVNWGKRISTIEKNAFRNCIVLKDVTLGAKVKKIGSAAFRNCKKLSSLTVVTTKLNDTGIGENAFYATPKSLRVYVPESKLEAYKELFVEKGVKNTAVFTVPKG